MSEGDKSEATNEDDQEQEFCAECVSRSFDDFMKELHLRRIYKAVLVGLFYYVITGV